MKAREITPDEFIEAVSKFCEMVGEVSQHHYNNGQDEAVQKRTAELMSEFQKICQLDSAGQMIIFTAAVMVTLVERFKNYKPQLVQ